MNRKSNSKSKKDLPEPRVSPNAIIVNGTSGLSREAEDRFELELCWCIQQLEASLASGKLHKKQTQDTSKHLQSLKSNSASLIKKRQIMKNTLGDYREKMTEDERKLSKTVSTVKFTCSASANKKSMFIRKAAQHTTEEPESQTDDHKVQDKLINTKAIMDNSRSQASFQFNFQTC
ncbi:hypothetical protein DMN91_006942 [Ooceraea biroi]|uniref:Uncharacterized protein n=1 Tax=Ooceraea biroi TaxID=2015173 RepID=A0A026W9B9_OOCBI|nr:UPF0488 protein CG14286 [Ooceraea biroi]EZA52271.1 hypothetical protein X777_08941 [Ooceraea biroi]RLU20334.1 hypothetical protein DMN91_006942 [Ooceraea biroi]